MSIFDRIVAGVDETPESLEATRQATRLVAPEGSMLLATVEELGMAAQAGWATGTAAEQIATSSQAALERARLLAPGAETRLVSGRPLQALLEILREEAATLVAVGTHNVPRAAAVLLGRVSTSLLHNAPCSVLIARASEDSATFPRSIVVGLDGSPAAHAAARAASELGSRLGAHVRGLVALGGKDVDPDAARDLPDVQTAQAGPVELLVGASQDADLVVVGSRGLHGLRSLGSVSERVAHEAACSVLVVRADV
jgi:nucleotide-binding universal stress UspA family protein